MADIAIHRDEAVRQRARRHRDVDLDVADGELLVLVGPSGCGKSTLLRMVAGLEEPTEGSIAIGGRDVTDLAPKDRDIAMVFQTTLVPNKTVHGNIVPAEARKVPGSEIDRRVRDAARLLQLDTVLESTPAQLSGGQRQRAAMGRAIVRQPQAFLMDEPLSNLDATCADASRDRHTPARSRGHDDVRHPRSDRGDDHGL